MSPLSSYLSEIKLTCVIFSILCVFSLCWHIYHPTTVNGKCSPKYPELSVRLYDPEWLPDGGVREGSDGEVYPKGAWWLGDGKVQGCPCSRGKPCIRKCCDFGYMFRLSNNGSAVCVPLDDFTEPDIYVDVYELSGTPPAYDTIEIPPDHFQFITDPKCNGDIYGAFERERLFVILTDGTLAHTGSATEEYYFDQTDFCLEYWADLNRTAHYFCDKLFYGFEYKLSFTFKLNDVPFMAMIPISAATLLVYILVPRLRRGYGKPVMCLLVTGILDKVIYLIRTNIPHCVIGADIYFLVISEDCWSAVVCYYMWLAAGPGVVRGVESRSRFLYCCGLAWGIPVVFAVLAEAANNISAVPSILKPGFASIPGSCSFASLTTKWLYYLAPSTSAKLTQLGFSVATLMRLAAGERNAKTLQGTESRRHNANEIKWISLYAKVAFILGLNYVIGTCVELFTWVVAIPPALRQAMPILSSFHGVEVFLVFVCQWDTLCSVFKRLAFWRHHNNLPL